MTERWNDETLDRFASTVATAIATNKKAIASGREAIAANAQAIASLNQFVQFGCDLL